MQSYKGKGHGSKSKKNYFYKKPEKAHQLQPGFKGFMFTFNFQEKESIKEAYNLLDEYAEIVFKSEECKETEVEDVDNLSQEIQKLKSQADNKDKKRFQLVMSFSKSILFFQTIVEDPVKLAYYIVKDIRENEKAKTRFLLRLIPIEVTCRARLDTLKQACLPLLQKYFTCECTTYSIVYNHRCDNNVMDRMDVITAVAELVASIQPDHKVDLEKPHLSIIIEVIKGIALVGVLPDFIKYKKYNIHITSIEESVQKD